MTDCGKWDLYLISSVTSLTEHLAFDEIVLFKGTVIVKEYIPKKHKWFGNKFYKLCDSKEYHYNMTKYKCRECNIGLFATL